MKYLLLISFFIIISCQGKLTEEQKRKIREEREQSQIRKISEATITEAAFAYGRTISAIIERRDNALSNKILVDSLENAFGVQIILLQKETSNLCAVERQVLEAYTESKGISLTDNIQKMGKDTLLYTKPITKTGDNSFAHAIALRMPKRQVIQTIR
jgi:predicted NAD-dependent protein-ADP-ribosyltransferase YbiA (DUF1768 family)